MAAPKLSKADRDKIRDLCERGFNKSDIERETGLSRNTIRKYWPASSTSTLYQNGEKVMQWVKTQKITDDFEETATAIVEALCASVKPVKPIRQPKATRKDRMAAYLIGDAHIGMLAWQDEAGDNFDTKIAKRDLCKAMEILISDTPPTDECVILNLGDWYHMDDRMNQTPGSKNPLDVDGRYIQVMRVGIEAMRHLIELARTKHRVVRVRNVAGNHDPHSSITLTLALSALYDKDPRVIVEDSPKSFWPFRFGKNLVGVHHGDKLKKPQNQAMFLASECRKDWSACPFRYVWHGHIHHIRAEEHMGVVVESFRTLATADAWHAASGYKSGNEMKAIVLDREYGEVARHTASLSRVRA